MPAVLMPIAIAIASILNTFTLVWMLTYITDVSIIVQFLIALVGLGVAIDYALLMIFRFRDELREGSDVETAIVETMTHAGRSVIVSGSTVAVGLLSMVFLPLPFIRSIGIGGMLIPLVSVIAAITLLPAMLSMLGTRINSLRVLPRRLIDDGHPEDGWWGRWARFVIRRPWPIAAVGLVIVGVLVFEGFQLNASEAQVKYFPGTGDAIDGREALAAAGISAGVMKPFVVLVSPGADKAAIVTKLESTPGIAGAVAPAAWQKDGYRLIEAFPADDGCRATAIRSRSTTVRASSKGTERAARRGRPVEERDFVSAVYGNFPYVLAFVLLLTSSCSRGRSGRRARAQGGDPQPDLARGRLRDHRLHLPEGPRLGGDLGHPRDPVDHPVDPADDLRVPVRALDGLRGLHAHPDAGGLRRDGRHRHRDPLGLARTGKLVTSAALVLMFAFFVLSRARADIKQFGDRPRGGDHLRRDRDPGAARAVADELLGDWNWWLPNRPAAEGAARDAGRGQVRPEHRPARPPLDSVPCAGSAEIALGAGRVDRDRLAAMSATLVHRGPDSDGTFVEGGVGLAARRLAIIDLERGDQPISNEDGTCTVVQNGEIYNHARAAPRARARRPPDADATRTPRRRACVRAMGCLALRSGCEGCSRSRSGTRAASGSCSRATGSGSSRSTTARSAASSRSPPSSTRCAEGRPRPRCARRVPRVNSVPAPLSIFREIRKLPPGHVLTWEEGPLSLERFARPGPVPLRDLRDEAELLEEAAPALRDSVAAHLVSRRPRSACSCRGASTPGR